MTAPLPMRSLEELGRDLTVGLVLMVARVTDVLTDP